jgi:hypothetical protein
VYNFCECTYVYVPFYVHTYVDDYTKVEMFSGSMVLIKHLFLCVMVILGFFFVNEKDGACS